MASETVDGMAQVVDNKIEEKSAMNEELSNVNGVHDVTDAVPDQEPSTEKTVQEDDQGGGGDANITAKHTQDVKKVEVESASEAEHKPETTETVEPNPPAEEPRPEPEKEAVIEQTMGTVEDIHPTVEESDVPVGESTEAQEQSPPQAEEPRPEPEKEAVVEQTMGTVEDIQPTVKESDVPVGGSTEAQEQSPPQAEEHRSELDEEAEPEKESVVDEATGAVEDIHPPAEDADAEPEVELNEAVEDSHQLLEEPQSEVLQNVPVSGQTETSPAVEDIHQSGNEVQPEPEATELVEGVQSTDTPTADEASIQKENKEEEDPWMDVLGNGELKKKVLTSGEGRDTRPVHGDLVTLSYEGRLETGQVVDKEDSAKITLGDGDVIPALDLCCALMHRSEVAEIITSAKYAYGDLGREPDIQPNTTLTYTAKVISVENAPDYSKYPVVDRIHLGNQKRERGNTLYARGEFSGAINSYTKALKILDDSSETHTESADELQKLVDTRVKCYNNLAAAQLKVEAYEAALKSCEEVLKVQSDNVKALFRKGKCHAANGDTKDAITLMQKALKLDPESQLIHNELSRLTKRQKAMEKSEKEMYQRMMGQSGNKANPQGKEKQNSRWWLYAGGAAAAALVSVGVAAYRYSSHL